MAGNLFDLDEIFPAAAPTAAAKPSTNEPAIVPPTFPASFNPVDEIAELIAEAQAIAAHLERDVLLNDLLAFTRAAWHIVEPKITFRSNWHIEAIAAELTRVANGELKRLIINVPPGTMKSLLVSVFFPAWLWARDGSKRFLTASYGATLATRDNVRVRSVIESAWYQERFALRLSEDQKVAGASPRPSVVRVRVNIRTSSSSTIRRPRSRPRATRCAPKRTTGSIARCPRVV
jgi:hypothetical protein